MIVEPDNWLRIAGVVKSRRAGRQGDDRLAASSRVTDQDHWFFEGVWYAVEKVSAGIT